MKDNILDENGEKNIEIIHKDNADDEASLDNQIIQQEKHSIMIEDEFWNLFDEKMNESDFMDFMNCIKKHK